MAKGREMGNRAPKDPAKVKERNDKRKERGQRDFPQPGGRGIRRRKGWPTAEQMEFLRVYHKTGSSSQAAEAVGRPSRTCEDWLKHPAIIEALTKLHDEVRAEVKYDLVAAMKEADEAIAFAKMTRNANAYVKALELKQKMNGLIQDIPKALTVPLLIKISGVRDENPVPIEVIPQPIVETLSLPSANGSDASPLQNPQQSAENKDSQQPITQKLVF